MRRLKVRFQLSLRCPDFRDDKASGSCPIAGSGRRRNHVSFFLNEGIRIATRFVPSLRCQLFSHTKPFALLFNRDIAHYDDENS